MTGLPAVAMVMWVFAAVNLKYGDPRAGYMFLGAAIASTSFAGGQLIVSS